MSFFDDASLVMIPSGYKASKVYSVKPTDGTGDLVFTRALDTATRVGPDGLIEKVRTNIILHSNGFDNAAWTKTASGTGLAPVVTANAGIAPDGTNTAFRVQFDCVGSLAGDRSRLRQTITSVIGTPHNYSFFIKAFSAQEVGKQVNFFADGGTATALVVVLTADYQRVSFSGPATITSVLFTIETRGTLANTTADVLLAFSQAETGDIATDYIPTTTAAVSVGMLANVPRLDYYDTTCPKLLLEPQRTNLVTFSEQLNNAAWAKTSITVTENTTISPDGFQNADSLEFSASTSRATRTLSLGAGTYTASVYAKLVSGTGTARINLVVDNLNTSLTFTPTNEWERYTLTVTAATDLTQYQLRGSGGTPTVAFWGAQLEVGAFATSYIPTLEAAVTRSADAASKTGISALIGQTEGTLFVELQRLNVGISAVALQFNDGTNNNRVQIEIGSDGQTFAICSNGGATTCLITGPTLTLGQTAKIGFSYKLNDFKLFVNGVLGGVDTLGAVPVTMSRLDLASEVGVPYAGYTLSQALHFKTALTSNQLAELTA